MENIRKYFLPIGNFLIISSIAMFLFGIGLFTYRGNELNSIIIKIGQFSFSYWLPILCLGILFTSINKNKSNKNL